MQGVQDIQRALYIFIFQKINIKKIFLQQGTFGKQHILPSENQICELHSTRHLHYLKQSGISQLHLVQQLDEYMRKRHHKKPQI